MSSAKGLLPVILVGILSACGGGDDESAAEPAPQPPTWTLDEVSLLYGNTGGRGNIDGAGDVARFDHPEGIAVDGGGNVYVTDTNNNTVRKITAAGVVSTIAGVAGEAGSQDGAGNASRFNGPTGIAIDLAGNLYVADTGNHTIRKITSSGVVATIAGMAGAPGYADGVGTAALFNLPSGVAVDASGMIYVADRHNNTIRTITPSGTVATLAGATTSGYADAVGTQARFSWPAGIAVDSSGYVYVSDSNYVIRKIAPSGLVSTLAGTAGSYGYQDGTGAAARFKSPEGLAVDLAGNVFVADSFSYTIRKVTPSGVVTTVAGTANVPRNATTGEAEGYLYFPHGVAVDANGTLYVADTSHNMIRRQTLSGGLLGRLAGSAGVLGLKDERNILADVNPTDAWFNYPTGIALTSGISVVYVADRDNGRVRRVSLINGEGVQTLIGTFSQPSGVATDSNGSAYVTNNYHHTIDVISDSGVSTFAGSGSTGAMDGVGTAASFANPYGIAIDGNNILYVSDVSNGTIRKVTSTGVVSTLAGTADVLGSSDGAGAAAQFDHPRGVAVDTGGNVYVADTQNSTIRKISPAGVVTTMAGLASTTGSTDGVGSAARFKYPEGVAVDKKGNVYVADTGNFTVRKITPAGQVSTIAGTAGQEGAVLGSLPGIIPRPLGIAFQDETTVDFGENKVPRYMFYGPTIWLTTPYGVLQITASSD